MVLEEIRHITSDKRSLRKFGITVGVALGLLGLLLLWRQKEVYLYLLILGAVFLGLGLAWPGVLKPVHRVWMTIAVLMGWLMTRVILTVLFFVLITPISLLGRVLGRGFLEKSFDREASSYWIKRTGKARAETDYERQF